MMMMMMMMMILVRVNRFCSKRDRSNHC